MLFCIPAWCFQGNLSQKPRLLISARHLTEIFARQIYCVDRVPERLAKAASFGCIPIDFSKGDAVDQIIAAHGGMVDRCASFRPLAPGLSVTDSARESRSVDAVGYQASASVGNTELPNVILSNLIRVTRACGGLGIVGLYVPKDPGAPDTASVRSISFSSLLLNRPADGIWRREHIGRGESHAAFWLLFREGLNHGHRTMQRQSI